MINTQEGQSAELRLFSGVMDKDSDIKDVVPGNYRELRNCRNSVTNRVENLKGFLQIANPDLYLGTNKDIMTHEDIKGNSILFAIYNSLGYHGIFRYYRNRANLPDGVIEKIIQINHPQNYTSDNPNALNFDPDFLITGTALVNNSFFWTDYKNSPKVIDIERANETNKHRQFNINFNRASFIASTDYVIEVFAPTNPLPVFTATWTSAATDYEGRVLDFVTVIQALTGVPFTITKCKENVSIEMTLPGRYFVRVGEFQTLVPAPYNYLLSLVVPDNFYPDTDLAIPGSYTLFRHDLIERMRPVPFQEPRVSYATDPARTVNLVKDKVFQFRCLYRYYDYTKSTWGAISNIALPSHACSDNNYGNNDNYLNVDFSDVRLEDPALTSIIHSVDLAVREHNEGLWRLVKTFEQYEITGAGQANYRFYNDGNYAAIDQAETSLPHYAVPNHSKSLEIVDDRLFDGGIIEGYDRPCPNVKLEVTYLDQITPRTSTITGRAIIKNFNYLGGSAGQDTFPDQPIWKDTTSGEYYWGGFERSNNNQEAIQFAVAYKQSIPLAGFIAYLAGTNFFGKTTQKFAGTQPSAFGLTVEAGTGAINFDSTNQVDRVAMWNYLSYLFIPTNSNNCYQEFVIQGVPNGRYIQRFASHYTESNDLGSSSLNFQTRSTNAFVFQGTNFNLHELELVVNNANLSWQAGQVLDWNIHDLGGGEIDNCGICGYIVDGTGLTAPTTVDEYMALPRVDLCRYIAGQMDHNGYFYFVDDIPTGGGNINPIQSGTVSTNWLTALNIDGTAWAVPAAVTGETGVFLLSDTNLKQNCRTHFTGTVVDQNGDPVASIAVVNTRGAWDQTDSNGTFNIIGYADTLTFPSTTRADKLIFSTIQSVCLYSFSYDNIVYSITINNSGAAGTFNDFNTNPLWYIATPNLIATLLLSDLSISAFGRGVDIPIGIEYLDDGDRVCAVAFIEDLHILYYTEPDSNGSIPPRGRPVVTWAIFHEPPAYAVKYQFVRGLSSLQNQLMWDANFVTAVADDFVTPVGTNPKFWRINFDNIAYYVNVRHPQANIAFTYQKGDRVRFVKDGGNNYYNVYYDVEIVKVDNQDVYIDYDANLFATGAANNTLLQLYTPRGVTQTRIFYEFGETYPVKSAMFFGVRKYYHEGPTGNQSYGPLPLQIVTPATGVFKTGDQYYRLREMPTGVPAAIDSSTGDKIEYIYDQAVSDFYSSTDQSIGRPNTDSIEIGRIERPTAIRFTDRYIPGSKVNGLCAFQPLNQKQFSTDYGLMVKLKNLNDDVLKAVFYNSFQVSMYINKGILREATGQTIIAISEDVIPRTNVMQRTFGSRHPESIWLNDEGDLFGWDENEGVQWRSSGDALVQISDYGCKTYHKDIASARNALDRKKSQVPGVYDLYNDEFITFFTQLDPDVGLQPELKVCLPDIDIAAILNIPNTGTLLTATFNFSGTAPIVLFNISKNDFAQFTDFGELVKFAINNNIGIGTPSGFTAETNDDGCVIIKAPNDSVLYGGLGIQFDLVYGGAQVCDYDSINGISGSLATFKGIRINGIDYPYPATAITNTIAISAYLNSLNLGVFIVSSQFLFGATQLIIGTIANTNTVQWWVMGTPLGDLTPGFAVANCGTDPIHHKYFVYNFSKGAPIGISQTPFLQDSIAFCKHTGKNGWTSHYDFDGLEYCGRIRNDLVAFKAGELWLLDALAAPDYNLFFGIKKPSLMRYPVNKDYDKVKLWNQITLAARTQWYVPVNGISVPPQQQTPQGMLSELNALHFELIEGKFYAALLNDVLTPNEPTYDEALINGRPLRGQAMEILLQNDDTDETVLTSASVGYMYSDLS